MASDAYLKLLEEMPNDISSDVLGSIDIANEIYLVLKEKNMNSADLARMLKKSESEISKWMTGLHNFTFKTVRKIENALDTKLVVTKSTIIEEYEKKLNELNQKNARLQNKIENSNYLIADSFSYSLSLNAQTKNFFIDNKDSNRLKIKPQNSCAWDISRKIN